MNGPRRSATPALSLPSLQLQAVGKPVKVDKPTTKTVPVKGAKNGKERVVPINHDVSCVCV